MTPLDITESVFKKFDKLKFFKDMEEHTAESIKIILEETLNKHFKQLKPRDVTEPVFYINKDVKILGRGLNPGKRSKYKFHLMEVGDVLECERRVDQLVRMSITDFTKRHRPDWKFEKLKRPIDEYGYDSEYHTTKFKRIA